jgi:hypothetical protein
MSRAPVNMIYLACLNFSIILLFLDTYMWTDEQVEQGKGRHPVMTKL